MRGSASINGVRAAVKAFTTGCPCPSTTHWFHHQVCCCVSAIYPIWAPTANRSGLITGRANGVAACGYITDVKILFGENSASLNTVKSHVKTYLLNCTCLYVLSEMSQRAHIILARVAHEWLMQPARLITRRWGRGDGYNTPQRDPV